MSVRKANTVKSNHDHHLVAFLLHLWLVAVGLVQLNDKDVDNESVAMHTLNSNPLCLTTNSPYKL